MGIPRRLRDAAHPLELLYFQGSWDLIYTRSVSVVGTRSPSAKGKARTRSLVKKLVKDGFTIVSGLAAGIDTGRAHRGDQKRWVDNSGNRHSPFGDVP